MGLSHLAPPSAQVGSHFCHIFTPLHLGRIFSQSQADNLTNSWGQLTNTNILVSGFCFLLVLSFSKLVKLSAGSHRAEKNFFPAVFPSCKVTGGGNKKFYHQMRHNTRDDSCWCAMHCNGDHYNLVQYAIWHLFQGCLPRLAEEQADCDLFTEIPFKSERI